MIIPYAGPSLDALAAEHLMGWQHHCFRFGNQKMEMWARIRGCIYESDNNPPPYSHNKERIWELMAALTERFGSVSISTDDTQWHKTGTGWKPVRVRVGESEAWGANLCEQLCKAGLREHFRRAAGEKENTNDG